MQLYLSNSWDICTYVIYQRLERETHELVHFCILAVITFMQKELKLKRKKLVAPSNHGNLLPLTLCPAWLSNCTEKFKWIVQRSKELHPL